MKLFSRFCGVCYCVISCGIAYGLNSCNHPKSSDTRLDSCDEYCPIQIEKYDNFCHDQSQAEVIRDLLKRITSEYPRELGVSGESIFEFHRNNLYIIYGKRSDLSLIPMGFVVFRNKLNSTGDMSGFINFFGIDTPYQRSGLGKILLEYAINKLKNKGAGDVSLWVLDRNYKAIQLYNKFGFVKEIDNSAPPGSYVLMKALIEAKKRK